MKAIQRPQQWHDMNKLKSLDQYVECWVVTAREINSPEEYPAGYFFKKSDANIIKNQLLAKGIFVSLNKTTNQAKHVK